MPGARRGAEEREGRVAGGERGGCGGEDGRAVTLITTSGGEESCGKENE